MKINRFFCTMPLCFYLGMALPNKALDVVWPLPLNPPNTNPVTVPTPRLDWLAKFQANLDRSKGKQIDLVFDGDSITDIWQYSGKNVWSEHYAALNAFDFGIAGDKVEHLLWRLQQGELTGIDPKLIVLLIGTNNLDSNSPDQIAGGIKALVAEYLKLCPKAHLLLLGIFPRAELASDPLRAQIAPINQQIAPLADGVRVTYLDIGEKLLQPDGSLSKEIMPDLLHPSEKGYRIWAEAIQPVITQYFPAPSH